MAGVREEGSTTAATGLPNGSPGTRVGVGYVSLTPGPAPTFSVSSLNPYTQSLDHWRLERTTGDSGHAAILLADGTPILLGLWQYATSGPTPAGQIAAVDTAISALGSAARLAPVDVTGYASF